MQIDLNADLGEGYGPWQMGDDDAMLRIVSSANIACGGHAGDSNTMKAAVSSALRNGVTIGAHPGFEDRRGFGRRRLSLSTKEIENLIASQVGALAGIAALAGTEVAYVKPHGALANWVAEDRDAAAAVARAVKAVMPKTPRILAISGSELVRAATDTNIEVYAEVFADRGYTPDGLLVPRDQPGALIHDVDYATERLLHFINTGEMPTVSGDQVRLAGESVCVHGDSAVAVAMAQAIRNGLEKAGVTVAPFCSA